MNEQGFNLTGLHAADQIGYRCVAAIHDRVWREKYAAWLTNIAGSLVKRQNNRSSVHAGRLG